MLESMINPDVCSVGSWSRVPKIIADRLPIPAKTPAINRPFFIVFHLSPRADPLRNLGFNDSFHIWNLSVHGDEKICIRCGVATVESELLVASDDFGLGDEVGSVSHEIPRQIERFISRGRENLNDVCEQIIVFFCADVYDCAGASDMKDYPTYENPKFTLVRLLSVVDCHVNFSEAEELVFQSLFLPD